MAQRAFSKNATTVAAHTKNPGGASATYQRSKNATTVLAMTKNPAGTIVTTTKNE